MLAFGQALQCGLVHLVMRDNGVDGNGDNLVLRGEGPGRAALTKLQDRVGFLR